MGAVVSAETVMFTIDVASTVGPIVGAGITSGAQASGGITNACNNLIKEKQIYQETKQKWNNVISGEEDLIGSIQEYSSELRTKFSNYQSALKESIDQFKVQEKIQIISLSILVFFICLQLLLKYFNVYENIFKLFKL